MLEVGQRLFEYEIIRPLGQGGFAAVYEARDRILNRSVAIKELLVQKAADEQAVKRFVQEGRVIATLEHPNIVGLYGMRMEQDKFYMIMEYIAGGSLRDLLNKYGKMPVDVAINLTIGICEGLAKLHEKGIIHRDIKAENILITMDGRPKVIDFGIAHVPEAAGGLELTQAGFQPSTLLYSSPEQVQGEKLDARSDVYQIGQLLYYMLAGQHYIDIDTLEKQALTDSGKNQFRSHAKLYQLLEIAICEEMPQGLAQLWREVGALAGVVETTMAKNKADRFKDADELAATLKTMEVHAGPETDKTDEMGLQDARFYNKRGLSHVSTRNYEQAIVEYSRAIKLDEHYAEAYSNRSTAHILMSNYGEAVADCNRALKLAPNFVSCYVNRGIAYTGLRDYEKALADYDKALELTPKNAYAYFNRGNTYLWMTQYEDAIADYDQALTFDPDFLAAYVNRGVVYTELKDSQQALADFDQAILLNPEYVYAYFNRANMYRDLQKHEEAVADYSKVIELNPEHRFAYENRGDSLAALGKDEQASDDYTKIIIQTSAIHPKRLSVARSMLMPTTPLDFLKK